MDCRLYLVTPPELASGGLALEAFVEEKWKPAFQGGDVAAVLIRTSKTTPEDEQVRMIEALRDPAQDADAAVILEYRADWAVSCGADGVHLLANEQNVKSVRKALGDDMIVGAGCGNSRHLAMIAAEADADYVCFGELEVRRQAPDAEVIQWWSEIMETPCVALGGITLGSAPEMIDAGADFICVGTDIWDSPHGSQAAVAAFNELLKEFA
jgi:thiamine-phosphate pyrophosphorylase